MTKRKLAVTAATVFAVSTFAVAAQAQVPCTGVNACKGQSACKSAKTASYDDDVFTHTASIRTAGGAV